MLCFLGGTCGSNKWRDEVEKQLTTDNLFNPVVDDWNEAAQAAEDEAKKLCTHMVFYIGNPGTGGLSAYSLVEATMALYDQLETTVITVAQDEFEEEHLKKSLNKTVKDWKKRFPNAAILETLQELIEHLRKEGC